MKQLLVYHVNLLKLDGCGDFPCPCCGVSISPEDETEYVYSVLEAKVRNDILEDLLIVCNNCSNKILLTGFSFLESVKSSHLRGWFNLELRAIVVVSCWFTVALISSVYMLVFGSGIDIMFGIFIPIGMLILVAVIVTFVVLFSFEPEKNQETEVWFTIETMEMYSGQSP